MKAFINKTERIAENTLLVEFKTEHELDFEPGQFFMIKLKELKYNDERGAQRHFSIVNPPRQKHKLVMATRTTGSGFKKTLEEMQPGEEAEITGTAGSFRLPDNKNAVFIAGGIGITPYMSMLAHIKENKLDYDITLLYSNRSRKSTAFYNELLELEQEMPGLKIIMTMTDEPEWKGEHSKIDSELVKQKIKDYKDKTYLIAGPPGMTPAVSKELAKAGIADDRIKPESFTGY